MSKTPRKSKLKPQEVVDPIAAWLAELAKREEDYRTGTGSAADLIACLNDIGKLGHHAEPMIPTLGLLHRPPGGMVIPEETIYWDWTMDDSCKEVLPAKLALVSSGTMGALGQIGPAALPQLEDVCRWPDPRLRRVAINVMNRLPMVFAARRVEALGRAELAKPDCINRKEAADAVCQSRLTADPTASAAMALIGDSVVNVVLAAFELTYNSWVTMLTPDQQREAGAEFRAALVARVRDPEPRIPPKAVAALMNHYIASRDIEPAVRRLAKHPDPAVRQQVGNVLGLNDFLGLPPTGRAIRNKILQ